MDSDRSSEQRRVDRKRVLYAAHVTNASVHLEVRLIDISPLGARVDRASGLAVGETVALSRGEHQVLSEVVWAEEDRAGLAFLEPAPSLASVLLPLPFRTALA